MTVVHYRKGPSKKTLNFTNITYYRTEAHCGKFSEVINPDKGMKHTDDINEVTCPACLSEVVIFDLTTPKPESGES